MQYLETLTYGVLKLPRMQPSDFFRISAYSWFNLFEILLGSWDGRIYFA
jgi:hypothetical protein